MATSGQEEQRQEATGANTISEMVLRVTDSQEGTACKYKRGDEWAEVTFAELGDDVRRLGRGLMALGMERGDVAAIFCDTRPEWVLADLACTCAGLTVATIYHTGSSEEARHILENSQSRLVFCETPDVLEKVKQARAELDGLEHAVLLEGEGEDALTLDDLRQRGEEVEDEALRERAAQVGGDDLFTLVYTSGTTGPAKGCRLTHDNVRAGLNMLENAVDFGESPIFYLFLPLAHVLSRMVELLALDVGATLAFWQRDKDKLLEDLAAVKPTHFAAVPRIFEKIYNRAASEAEGGIKGKLFQQAVKVGREVRQRQRRDERVGPVLQAEYELADRQIFTRVRDLFGGELRLAITGAAPVAKEMLEFFDACGVLVVEAWGLTESSGIGTANTPDELKFGTQGHRLGDCEVRIAEVDQDGDDGEQREQGEEDGASEEAGGEILLRGPNIFQGYHRMDEETGEALDQDGWFHTGDVGAIDEDGFLTISGRTKDIIVTSSGKNIPAARIENEIQNNRWISQAVVYGDDRNYLVALVTLDDEERSELAEQAGVDDDPEGMASSDAVRQKIEGVIDEANANFARVEQVKKFTILEHDFSQEEGELTPTLKVKRGVVYDNYRDRFEALYEEE